MKTIKNYIKDFSFQKVQFINSILTIETKEYDKKWDIYVI